MRRPLFLILWQERVNHNEIQMSRIPFFKSFLRCSTIMEFIYMLTRNLGTIEWKNIVFYTYLKQMTSTRRQPKQKKSLCILGYYLLFGVFSSSSVDKIAFFGLRSPNCNFLRNSTSTCSSYALLSPCKLKMIVKKKQKKLKMICRLQFTQFFL
jgi:hypothetical protein